MELEYLETFSIFMCFLKALCLAISSHLGNKVSQKQVLVNDATHSTFCLGMRLGMSIVECCVLPYTFIYYLRHKHPIRQ